MGPPETTIWEYPHNDESWVLETQDFVDDVRLGREPSPGLNEAVRTLEIVEQIYRKSGYPIEGENESVRSANSGSNQFNP
jgi:predicted dehydrogenase